MFEDTRLSGRYWIYVIGHDTGPQKVGFSNCPAIRAKALKVKGQPQFLVHYQHEVAPDDVRGVEALAHHLLDAKALGKERFDVTPGEAIHAVADATERYAAGERAPERTDLLTERINLVCGVSFVEMVNDWRRTQRPIPSWGKAVRDLVDRALDARDAKPDQP